MMDMFKKADMLDELGLFKAADCVDEKTSAVNFMLTKKKVNPQQQMKTQLDTLSSQMHTLQDSMQDDGGGDGDTNITLDNKDVEFKEKQ